LLRARVLTCASPAYLKRHGRPRLPKELEKHECLLFRDSATGRPFPWEFHQGENRITVAVKGQLILNDALTQLDTCLAGHGVAQLFDLGISHLLKSGKLINLFPDWSDELFPLYLYHTSRRIVPVKLRTFIDFVVSSLKGQP
jgi:DNA-binding transcriptional LysR family regulator